MSPEEAKRELQRIVDAEQVDLLDYIGWHEEVRDTGPAPIAEMSALISTEAEEEESIGQHWPAFGESTFAEIYSLLLYLVQSSI